MKRSPNAEGGRAAYRSTPDDQAETVFRLSKAACAVWQHAGGTVAGGRLVALLGYRDELEAYARRNAYAGSRIRATDHNIRAIFCAAESCRSARATSLRVWPTAAHMAEAQQLLDELATGSAYCEHGRYEWLRSHAFALALLSPVAAQRITSLAGELHLAPDRITGPAGRRC